MKTHFLSKCRAGIVGFGCFVTLSHTFATTFYTAAESRVRRLDPDGTRTLLAAGGNENQSVAFDSSGNLFIVVSDETQQYVDKLTPAGVLTKAVDNLGAPWGLAFDPLGNLYISERAANRITKVAPDGTRTIFADQGLPHPFGLAFDDVGNLFVANEDSIVKVTPDGVSSPFATTAGCYLRNLAFDSSGDLYASNGGGLILKYTPDGVGSVFAETSDGFYFRGGALAFDASDTLYSANGTGIAVFTPDGVGSYYLGDSDLELDEVIGLAIGPDVVPEPGTAGLLSLGMVALLSLRKARLVPS